MKTCQHFVKGGSNLQSLQIQMIDVFHTSFVSLFVYLFLCYSQLIAALTIDSVETIIRGLASLIVEDPDVLRSTFRRGQFFNNETRGIQCRGDPIIPWMHGPTIYKRLSAVWMYFFKV